MSDKLNPPSSPPPKFRLRKLRKGVTLHFSGYDLEGAPQWQLFDAGRKNFFSIGWPEYEMLLRWDLGDGQAIVDAVNRETTLDLELQDFENLREFIYKNFLVEHRWKNVYQQARDNKLIKGENVFYWFLRYYLFFRIPIFKPDKFLERTKWFGDFLFSRWTAYVMIGLGMVALYQIGNRWDEFVHTFSKIFSLEGLFFYFIAFTFAKVFHELGHAYMCKQYGVSVPTIGVAFLVFWPVMYTDTTLSWSLPSHERFRIALAGMWVETYVTIIAALIWANIHNVTLQMICYVVVAINWVSTLLINVSPFMRFDGYYALSDLLRMPNLQNRSFDLARWQIRNWLFGLVDPMHEPFSPKMHRILVTYAFITWAYRLIIYFGIALLVYHYFFKIVGIILFAIEIYVFILRPVIFELRRIYELKAQLKWNKRTIITLIVSISLISLLLIPINQTVKLNATLGYHHEFIFAPMEGVLENTLLPVGAPVLAGQTIVQLKSSDVEYNLKKSSLEYEKIKTKIRRASLDTDYTRQMSNLLAEQNEKKADYEKWVALKEKLILKAPFNGKIADVPSGLVPGLMVMKNQYIMDVIDPNMLMLEAFVAESDVDLLKVGYTGFFYPNNLDIAVIPVKVVTIESINTKSLSYQFSKPLQQSNKSEFVVDTPSYHASELGGKIPTEITEDNKYVPIESIYRVILTAQEPIEIKNIQSGVVTIFVKPRPFAEQTFRKIKGVFIKESGF